MTDRTNQHRNLTLEYLELGQPVLVAQRGGHGTRWLTGTLVDCSHDGRTVVLTECAWHYRTGKARDFFAGDAAASNVDRQSFAPGPFVAHDVEYCVAWPGTVG